MEPGSKWAAPVFFVGSTLILLSTGALTAGWSGPRQAITASFLLGTILLVLGVVQLRGLTSGPSALPMADEELSEERRVPVRFSSWVRNEWVLIALAVPATVGGAHVLRLFRQRVTW